MLISTRSRYGLRALVQITRSKGSKALSLAEIAKTEDIPIRYLEQIFGKLRTAKIVTGRRGPGGGYKLCRDANEILLLEIIRVLETEFFQTDCILACPDFLPESVPADVKHAGCKRESLCPTKKLWSDIKLLCENYLGKNTLADLSDGSLEMER